MRPTNPSRSFPGAAWLALGLVCAPVMAQVADAEQPRPVTSAWRLTDETYELPGGERMGMAGATWMFDVDERWSLGVASYGAVRGERGGFITLGVAGEARQPLADDWTLRGGLFVGAGGGRGGYTLAGGGLMLRADVGVAYDLGDWGRIGAGVSHVDFPSGVIRSTQPYLLFEHRFHSLLGSGWARPTGAAPSSRSLTDRPQEFSVTARSYDIDASAVQDDGVTPQHPSMQLVGFEWLSYIDPYWYLRLGAEGAGGGRSDGYMQILAGGGYRVPLGDRTGLKMSLSLGAAGGGGVDTGGGVLVESGVALQHALTRGLSVEVGLSDVRAPGHSFRAQSLTLKLTHPFGVPLLASGGSLGAGALGGFDPQHLRVRLAHQTYFEAAPNWRNRFQDTPVSNLGVQLDYFMTPEWFLSGQGLAAYEGKAGAYMIGLIGLGGRLPLGERWYAEAEALAGAAGGGGLQVGGGAVAQLNGSLGYRVTRDLAVQASLGHLTAPRGDLRAHVAGLSLAWQFTGWSSR